MVASEQRDSKENHNNIHFNITLTFLSHLPGIFEKHRRFATELVVTEKRLAMAVTRCAVIHRGIKDECKFRSPAQFFSSQPTPSTSPEASQRFTDD